MCGDDRALAVHLGKTKYVLEYWYVKVRTGNTNKSECTAGMALEKVPQNQFRIVLTSVFIIGKTWGFYFEAKSAPKATSPFDTLRKVFKYVFFNETYGAYSDAS